MSTEQQGSAWLNILAEAALVFMSAAAFASFGRVFVDAAWRPAVLTAVLVAHLVSALGRRGRVPLAVVFLFHVLGLVLSVGLTHYRPTLRFGFFPTAETRIAADADLTAAWTLFGDVGTPTESAVGFTIMIVATVWLVAFLADWAAFRLWSAMEALVPAFAVVVFVSFFGGPERRTAYTIAYVASLLVFCLTHRVAKQARTARWLADGATPGRLALLRVGAALSLVAVLAAVVIGPRFPGADQQALIDVDEQGSRDSARIVISPLVDIRGRLVSQSNEVAFTVRTSQPAYYRLASLDRFDGQVWGSQTTYADAEGELPVAFPSGATVTPVRQEFQVVNLGAVWVPGAFEPRALEEASVDEIRYESRSATLIVDKDLSSSDGITYTLLSAIPSFDPAQLAAAGSNYPEDIIQDYLDLPDAFSAEARGLAASLTEGLSSPYERALALQNYFRSTFAYDLDVAAGHSNRRVEDFLAERRGYCEQFAGTFAAMARSLGIPARVAVGFTWGQQDPDDPTLYRVRGEHAHAWPEVFVVGAGWVAFEPTPSRGAPGSASWTGVEAQQSGTGPGSQATPPPVPTAGINPDAGAVPTLPDEQSAGAPGQGGSAESSDNGWLLVPLVLLGTTAVGGLYLGLMALLHRERARRRRRRAGADARLLVGVAWHEATDALRPLGITEQPTETPQEFARRATTQIRLGGSELVDLGRVVTSATYSARPPTESLVSAAEIWADRVGQVAHRRATKTQRVRDILDPRTLVK